VLIHERVHKAKAHTLLSVGLLGIHCAI